jgi:stalled ribosome alternative rescue factor ArfA
MKKLRNIYAKELYTLGQFKQKVVKAKKGTGSFSRKVKHRAIIESSN